MNLVKLKHAVTLCEEGNFARAAGKLHISQPALSRSIAGLENELGLRLFDRDQAGASATVAGRQLVAGARDLLYAANSMEHELRALRACEVGQVAFGVGPFPAASFLPPVLTELAITHPRVRAVVEVNNSDFLLEYLKAEKIEFFIADTRTVVATKNIITAPFGRQRAALFCRTNHPLAAKSELMVDDLSDYSFASVHLPSQLLPLLRKSFHLKPEQELSISTMCDNVFVLKHVVIHSDTILMCSRAVVDADIRAGVLVELRIQGWTSLFAELGLVRLERRSLSPMAEIVIGKARGFIQEFSDR